MAKVLDLPKLSPTMEEGQIAKWHKKEGDAVAVDDLLAEVETDKATMEYRSFDKGTLLKILAPAGSVVRLGEPVAILGTPGEDISNLAPGSSVHNAPAAAPGAAPEQSAPVAAAEPASSVGASGWIKASPYVRKLAREQGLDLVSVAGSGPNGRIVARDLSNAKPAKQAVSSETKTPTAAIAPRVESAGALAEPEARPLSMMRKAIARRLTESKQTVPHFYLTIDVDADALHNLREQINQDLASQGENAPKVSFNDLIVKACATALGRVPECNAQFTNDAILVHRRVDISVAVSVPDGLVTPVVRNADRKNVLSISAEVRDLAARAKAKKLAPEEMSNGTFSISNLGMYGIDAFAAVINPPEGAILAVGQVRREPVVKGDAVVPGRKLAMTLSCDHRVIDGAVGASFLRVLRQILEHPTQILLQ
ncbi:MAG: pyruvate dehydrogenase complex dihydrolipoamide acetyltransferase [Polyangiaceae bacterium]|nr:pyruvate dehydrogenase complex dihydrolipoamide acetyltransferase [Polyangiaceae bacterium]